jgi:hypothetical protein
MDGMVLARPVVSPQGQLLAPKGTALTARHVRLFRMWGVTEADIEGHGGEAAPVTPFSEAERQAIEQSIGQRFAGVLDHPAMMEIARVATQLTLAREGRANG